MRGACIMYSLILTEISRVFYMMTKIRRKKMLNNLLIQGELSKKTDMNTIAVITERDILQIKSAFLLLSCSKISVVVL